MGFPYEFPIELREGETMTTELKIATAEEVAELRATPGVVFPTMHLCEIELSELDAIWEGVLPTPPGIVWADCQRPELHGPAGALLCIIANDCLMAFARTVTLPLSETFRAALDELVTAGRVKLLNETLTT